MGEHNVRKYDLPAGVYRNRGARYMAVVRHVGDRHYLGSYDTAEEASAQVVKFRKKNPRQSRGKAG